MSFPAAGLKCFNDDGIEDFCIVSVAFREFADQETIFIVHQLGVIRGLGFAMKQESQFAVHAYGANRQNAK